MLQSFCWTGNHYCEWAKWIWPLAVNFYAALKTQGFNWAFFAIYSGFDLASFTLSSFPFIILYCNIFLYRPYAIIGLILEVVCTLVDIYVFHNHTVHPYFHIYRIPFYKSLFYFDCIFTDALFATDVMFVIAETRVVQNTSLLSLMKVDFFCLCVSFHNYYISLVYLK